MAGCYEFLTKDNEAIKCYERAAVYDDRYCVLADIALLCRHLTVIIVSGGVCAARASQR